MVLFVHMQLSSLCKWHFSCDKMLQVSMIFLSWMAEPWNEASYNLLCFSKCVYSICIDVVSTLVVRSRVHVRELSSDQILSPNIPLISVTIIARKLSFGVCVYLGCGKETMWGRICWSLHYRRLTACTSLCCAIWIRKRWVGTMGGWELLLGSRQEFIRESSLYARPSSTPL